MSKYIVSLVNVIWSKLTSLSRPRVESVDKQPDVMRRMVLAGAVATVVVGLVGATMLSSPAEAQHYRRRSRRWRRRHYYRRSRRRGHYYGRSRRRGHYYRRSRRRRHYYRRSRRRGHYYGRSRRRHSYRRSRWY